MATRTPHLPTFSRHPEGLLNPPIFRAVYQTQACLQTLGVTKDLFSSQFRPEKKTLDFTTESLTTRIFQITLRIRYTPSIDVLLKESLARSPSFWNLVSQ